MVWETRVQFHVESYQRLKKWYLISPCLTLSIIRYISRVKWSNPENGIAPTSTHPRLGVVAIEKGAFGSPLTKITNFSLLIYIYIGLMSRVFSSGPGDWSSIPGRVMPPCEALNTIRSRVKWSNPGIWVAPSPTPWCSSYWKGSLQVTLDLLIT